MALLQRNRSDQSSALANRQQTEGVPLSQVMQRLFQDSVLLPSVFEGWTGLTAAAGTNLWESGDGYTLQVIMPGMKADSIKLTVEQNVLTIRGESTLQAPEQATAIWQSFGGQTEQQIALPGEVDPASAEASYEAGIVTVRLPKAAHAQAHTIKVVGK